MGGGFRVREQDPSNPLVHSKRGAKVTSRSLKLVQLAARRTYP